MKVSSFKVHPLIDTSLNDLTHLIPSREATMFKAVEDFAGKATKDVADVAETATKTILGDKGTATKDGRISDTTMFGGNGGDPFEDATTTAKLKEIRVRSGGRVDSFQCVYDNGTKTAYHGGQGGTDFIFRLGKDEAIITVNVWAQDTIYGIQFRTTKGRLSQHYGYGTGEPYICRGFEGHERALMGFRGRCACEIDAIEPMWSNTQELGPQLSPPERPGADMEVANSIW